MEAAISLAREGGQSVFYGPEPFCIVSKCYLRKKIRISVDSAQITQKLQNMCSVAVKP